MTCRRGLWIITLAAAGAALLLAGITPLLARPGVVTTRAGHVYTGEIDDPPGADYITVTVRGIPTRIARAEVGAITYGQDLDADYKQRLAALDAKDFRGRMELARWAFDRKRYDLARDAADRALEVDPNSAEATQFLQLIQSQQRMERTGNRATTQPEDTELPAQAATRRVADRVEWEPLNENAINRIRQEELRNADVRVRFQFRNDVERRFLAANRDLTLVGWRAMTPLQRAINILDRGHPSLRDDVIIASEPAAILEYRRLIQPLVLANCATTACHGGTDAGTLVLNTTADVNDAATYTNFYILTGYVQKMPMPGPEQGLFAGATVDHRMIDRMHPEESLLLEYGLPRNQARKPHPAVRNFRPAYLRGREDNRYQTVLRWIGQTLAPVEPSYGIDYRPPTGRSPGVISDGDGASGRTTQPVRRR